MILLHYTTLAHPIETIAIEPNPLREGNLRKKYSSVFPTTWDEWHAAHPDKQVDFIVSSHSLYYPPDPVRALDEMGEHLTPHGRMCIMLEDFNSGKLKLLQDAGILQPDEMVTPSGDISIINPRLLMQHIGGKFDLERFHRVPVNVTFDNPAEARDRFQGFFVGHSLPSSKMDELVASNTQLNPDGQYTWRRDSVAAVLRKRENIVYQRQ